MADLGPNLKLAEKRLMVQKQELTLVAERFELRNLEIEEELAKNNREIESVKTKSAQCDQDLAKVREALRGK